LDWRLGRALTGHETTSVQKMGWSGIKNGKLLILAAENKFDVFITGDRNLSFQQNPLELRVALIVLEARSVRLAETLPLMSKVLAALPGIKSGQILKIAA
jgi:hypothetical protein